jgi:hypothetical protein
MQASVEQAKWQHASVQSVICVCARARPGPPAAPALSGLNPVGAMPRPLCTEVKIRANCGCFYSVLLNVVLHVTRLIW